MKVWYNGNKSTSHHLVGLLTPGVNDIPDGAASVLLASGLVTEVKAEKKKDVFTEKKYSSDLVDDTIMKESKNGGR